MSDTNEPKWLAALRVLAADKTPECDLDWIAQQALAELQSLREQVRERDELLNNLERSLLSMTDALDHLSSGNIVHRAAGLSALCDAMTRAVLQTKG